MRRINRVVLAVLVTAIPATAVGGYFHAPQVNISTSQTTGSIVGARRSSDSLQYIGCYVRDSYVNCTARNASGAMSSCYSYTTEVRQAASAISPSSMIIFQAGPDGVCTFLSIGAMSQHLE